MHKLEAKTVLHATLCCLDGPSSAVGWEGGWVGLGRMGVGLVGKRKEGWAEEKRGLGSGGRVGLGGGLEEGGEGLMKDGNGGVDERWEWWG